MPMLSHRWATVRLLAAGLGNVEQILVSGHSLRCVFRIFRGDPVFCRAQELNVEVSRIKILVYRVTLSLCFESQTFGLAEYFGVLKALCICGNSSIGRNLLQPKPQNSRRSQKISFSCSFLIKSIKLCNLSCWNCLLKVFILSLKSYIVCYPHISTRNFLFTPKATVIILFVMQVQFKVTVWVI